MIRILTLKRVAILTIAIASLLGFSAVRASELPENDYIGGGHYEQMDYYPYVDTSDFDDGFEKTKWGFGYGIECNFKVRLQYRIYDYNSGGLLFPDPSISARHGNVVLEATQTGGGIYKKATVPDFQWTYRSVNENDKSASDWKNLASLNLRARDWRGAKLYYNIHAFVDAPANWKLNGSFYSGVPGIFTDGKLATMHYRLKIVDKPNDGCGAS